MKLNFFKSNYILITLLSLFFVLSYNYWSNFYVDYDAVLLSVDGSTHQSFGEHYTQSIVENGISSVFSNRYEHLGYGALFPDKYPFLHHFLVSMVQIITELPWALINSVLLFLYYPILIFNFFSILNFFDYKNETKLILTSLLVFILTSDNSWNAKGISLYSVFLVGLHSQLLFTVFLSYIVKLLLEAQKSNKFEISFKIKIFFSILLIFYSNLLSYPLLIFILALYYFINRKIFYFLLISFFTGIIFNLPWLIPFVKSAKYSATLTTFLSIQDSILPEVYLVWGFYVMAICLNFKRFKYANIFILSFIGISFLWFLSYDFLGSIKSLSFLFKVPFQFPRYWIYVYFCMILLSGNFIDFCFKKIRFKSIVLGIFYLFCFLFYPRSFDKIYLPFELQKQYEEISELIKNDKNSNPVVMIAVGHQDKNNKNEIIPTINIFTAALRTVLNRNKIAVNQVGYRENNTMQLLTIPLQNQLNHNHDISLVHIPRSYNELLSKALSALNYINLLKTNGIGYVICPDYKNLKNKKGYCYDLDFQKQSTLIYRKNFWSIYKLNDDPIKKYKDLVIFSKLKTKFREDLNDPSIITLVERMNLANLTAYFNSFFIDYDSFKEKELKCIISEFNKEGTIFAVHPNYKLSMEKNFYNLKIKPNMLFYEIKDIEDYLIFLKAQYDNSKFLALEDSQKTIINFQSSFGNRHKKNKLLITKLPFFEYEIDCD